MSVRPCRQTGKSDSSIHSYEEDTSSEDLRDNQLSEAEVRRKEVLSKIKIITISDLRKEWQARSDVHAEKQKRNPFSEDFDYAHAMKVRLHKGDRGYGRPEEGSKTEERGSRAHQHIHKEIEELCLIIKEMGVKGRDGRIRVTFGRLFQRYVRVSDKLVGMLLRARKHERLEFEGEMLWQGMHDHIVITLLD
ncbi:actin-binding Rho-activating protein-like [Pelobates fuscus]|uniref:actin-binding Rho-activating protein-like n=1 Tax=Pelobates fuscus TaxID=191477 RepID=UPI002FE4BEF5